MGVTVVQHMKQLHQITTAAAMGSLATPQRAKSTKVKDTQTGLTGREADKSMMAPASQLANPMHLKVTDLLLKAV